MNQRRPRNRDEKHMAFIRTLPCLLCTDDTTVECCHIRMADRSIAKPVTGMATKCDDRFTVPLCGGHHRQQHDHGNEHRWWMLSGIDPIKAALAIYSVSGDFQRGSEIVAACQERCAA